MKKRSKIVTGFAWGTAVLLVPACTLWFFGRWIYVADVLASQQMLIGWIALVVALLVLSTRRWGAGFLCLALALISLYPVLVGRTLLLEHVDFDHKPEGSIRVVSCNINPLNETWVQDVHRLLDLDADIVIVIELSPEMSRSINNRGAVVDDRYPHRSYRMWVRGAVSAGIIFSRWPMNALPTESDAVAQESMLFQQIDHPLGRFIVGLLHPASPRDKARWAIGNAVTQGHVQRIKAIESHNGLPIVVGVDLNAGPAQLRARTLKASNLRMSKPALRADASFPANSSVPRFLRVQLDDVWSVGTISPVAWDMIDVAGSDHRAVVVDFKLKHE